MRRRAGRRQDRSRHGWRDRAYRDVFTACPGDGLPAATRKLTAAANPQRSSTFRRPSPHAAPPPLRHRAPAHTPRRTPRPAIVPPARTKSKSRPGRRAHHATVDREQVAAQVMRGRRGVRRQRTCCPFRRVHQHFQRAGLAVEADHVALADLGQRATTRRFRRHMDGRRDLARRTGQAVSVTSATRRPWFCSRPSSGASECSSGMPLARGPW